MDLLLIDNSNIFIGLKNRYDYEARFNYPNFANKLICSKKIKKIIVGSTQQQKENATQQDSFWNYMKNKGFEVHTYERTSNGEKGVDGKIVALGVKAILKYRTEAGVMHLMSGDLDMKPLIEEALFNKWKVVLWTWKENLNSEFKNGPLSSSIQINYLDDIESEFVFFYNKEDSKKENIDERKKRKSREQTENNIAIAIIGGGLAGLAALATFVLKKISK
ncbi:NYN domain-containing protein [Neisseria subflava]|jgi:hypothetical protein|uniref:NYN domain-containing protein n=1 Tax=Neisseria subflava TaxID=28449 RepID=UPI0020B7D2E7|nr:NYN domain-containing protein [Neisseria subflava]UTG73288.1 NYN domain-containing protein [Neisseria subflava]